MLAGGRSSRMGRDKALLLWNGETLLERIAQAVEQAAGSALIVGDSERYGGFGYRTLPDRIPDCGPLGGIVTALAHSVCPWNLTVACDMPGVNAKALASLVHRVRCLHAEVDVLMPYFDGRAQPLCALYHRRGLPVIEAALRSGSRKVLDAIAPLRVATYASNDEELFRNVNTPEEWSAFVSR